MMQMSRWIVPVVFVLAAYRAIAKDEPVKVEKAKVAVEYRTFDPKNLPDPPPPLKGNEDAVCEYRFGVGSNIKYGYTIPGRRAGQPPPAQADVTVGAVDVNVSLSIVIWLPTSATPQLKAHEEGHRAIAEHYYKDAEAIARAVAKRITGRRFKVDANNAEAAAGRQIDRLNKELGDRILAALDEPCGKAQDVYDEMTNHGRKSSPKSDEAVKEAIERVAAKAK